VERVGSARPGDTVVRIRRAKFQGFSRTSEGHLAAGAQIEEPKGLAGVVKRWLVGAPIHSDLESHERLPSAGRWRSSRRMHRRPWPTHHRRRWSFCFTAGLAAAWWSLPIAIAVVLLLVTVVTSYRQTIYAYPSGGGSHVVAHANLGELAGLTAAAALIVGYILTVSVSIASAVDQLVSAVPDLLPLRVVLPSERWPS